MTPTNKQVFDEHNGPNPHPEVKDQCECEQCAAYRAESEKPKQEAAAAEQKAKQDAYDAEIAKRVAEELAKRTQQQ